MTSVSNLIRFFLQYKVQRKNMAIELRELNILTVWIDSLNTITYCPTEKVTKAIIALVFAKDEYTGDRAGILYIIGHSMEPSQRPLIQEFKSHKKIVNVPEPARHRDWQAAITANHGQAYRPLSLSRVVVVQLQWRKACFTNT